MGKIRDLSSKQGSGVGSRHGLGESQRAGGAATTNVPVSPLMVFFFIRVVFHGGASLRSLALHHARVHDCYFHVFPTLMGPIGRKIGNLGQ
jgi:hypothetical protein